MHAFLSVYTRGSRKCYMNKYFQIDNWANFNFWMIICFETKPMLSIIVRRLTLDKSPIPCYIHANQYLLD